MPASLCKVHVFPGKKCSRLLSIDCSFQLSGHRRTIIEELHEEEQVLVGGEDFQNCLDLFITDMTIYNTKRWYKENLIRVKRALENLNYSTDPIKKLKQED